MHWIVNRVLITTHYYHQYYSQAITFSLSPLFNHIRFEGFWTTAAFKQQLNVLIRSSIGLNERPFDFKIDFNSNQYAIRSIESMIADFGMSVATRKKMGILLFFVNNCPFFVLPMKKKWVHTEEPIKCNLINKQSTKTNKWLDHYWEFIDHDSFVPLFSWI